MTVDEAKAILLAAFVTSPDMDDEMRALIAKLIVPPRRRWRLTNPFQK